MTVNERRAAIEVLLCASAGYGVLYTSDDVEGGSRPRVYQYAMRCRLEVRGEMMRSGVIVDYAISATEAAYRLIESSPALRREWFGAR